MKKVYVVMGEAGEYSDHRSWVVGAFTDKNDATRLVKTLNDLSQKVNKEVEEKDPTWISDLESFQLLSKFGSGTYEVSEYSHNSFYQHTVDLNNMPKHPMFSKLYETINN